MASLQMPITKRRRCLSSKRRMEILRALFCMIVFYVGLSIIYLNFVTTEKEQRFRMAKRIAAVGKGGVARPDGINSIPADFNVAERGKLNASLKYETQESARAILDSKGVYDSKNILGNTTTVNSRDHLRETDSSTERPKLPNGMSDVCVDVFRGRISSVRLAKENKERTAKILPDTAFLNLTRNCADFKNNRGYILKPLSHEEADFPLAYAILMYKSAHQVEQLLQAIYRPQNFYCIHVDNKSSPDLHAAMDAIASCFPNVAIASENVKVIYQSIDQVTAEIICMRDLLRRSNKWRYYLNLAGQEFPLKTNLEIVQILRTYNGSNDVTTTENLQKYRQDLVHIIEGDKIKRTMYRKDPPPGRIPIYKGEFHSVLSRSFVDYILEKGVELYEWLADTQSPSEYFYPTLHRMPDAPGGFPANSLYLARAKMWNHMRGKNLSTCHGEYVRDICILTSRDVPLLLQQPQLFANKFYIDRDPLALDCLHEVIRKRSVQPVTLNLTLYSNFIRTRSFPECEVDMSTVRWWRMFFCVVRLVMQSGGYKWYLE